MKRILSFFMVKTKWELCKKKSIQHFKHLTNFLKTINRVLSTRRRKVEGLRYRTPGWNGNPRNTSRFLANQILDKRHLTICCCCFGGVEMTALMTAMVCCASAWSDAQYLLKLYFYTIYSKLSVLQNNDASRCKSTCEFRTTCTQLSTIPL